MLDDVLATKVGHVILPRGAAGIGKSRLAGEVLSAARQGGFTIHRSRMLDFGSPGGQHAVPRLVLSLLGLGPYSGAAERAGTADQAVEAGPIASARRGFLNYPPDLPQPLEFRRVSHRTADPAPPRGRPAGAGRPGRRGAH